MSRRVSNQEIEPVESPKSAKSLTVRTTKSQVAEASLQSPSQSSAISPLSSVSQRSRNLAQQSPKSVKSAKFSSQSDVASQKIVPLKHKKSSSAVNWVPAEIVNSAATTLVPYQKPSVLDLPRQFLKATTGNQWKKYCAICCCITFLLIGIIALIIYYGYWVGMPDVNVLGILAEKNGGKNKFALDLGSGGLRIPSVNFSVTIETIVANDNYMDLAFDIVDIYAYSAAAPTVELTRSTVYDLFLPKRTQIPLNLPVTLQFALNDANSAIPNDLVKSCTKKPGQQKPEKPIQLSVKIVPRLQLTSLIKINIPPIYKSPSFDCPFTADSQVNILGYDISLLNLDWAQIAQGKIAYIPSS